jgi:hypothetical protein
VTLKSRHPDIAPVSPSNSCTMTQSWLRCKLVPRYCTAAHFESFCTRTQYQSLIILVPRHSYRPETLYHDSKNRATPPTAWTQTPFIAGPLYLSHRCDLRDKHLDFNGLNITDRSDNKYILPVRNNTKLKLKQ